MQQAKLKLKSLAIQITRKCNYNCVHCGKGQAQDLTISKEIIDKMLSQISECEEIYLVGGEVLLELDVIEYLISALKKNNINTNVIQLTTNGSILSSRLINIAKSYIEKYKRLFHIRISNDKFHDSEQSKKAYNYYLSLIDEQCNRNIIIDYVNNFDSEKIIYSGNAIDIYKKNQHSLDDSFIMYPESKTHQILIENNKVFCGIELFANGNICTLCDLVNYQSEDKMSIGNILEKSLKQIIEHHNNNCVYLCDEIKKEAIYKSLYMFDYRYYDKEDLESKIAHYYPHILKELYLNYCWKAREIAHKHYPNILIREIINLIPANDFDNYVNKYDNESVNSSMLFYISSLKKQFPNLKEELYYTAARFEYYIKILKDDISVLDNNKLDNHLQKALLEQEQIAIARKHLNIYGSNENVNFNVGMEIPY